MSRRIDFADVPVAGTRSRGAFARFLRNPWELLALIVAAAAVAYLGAHYLSADATEQSAAQTEVTPVAVHFDICSGSQRITCVVDGDTIWLRGTKIRLADIDTPEIASPECAAEARAGERAKHRLTELLNAGPFIIEPYGRDTDRFGRELRVVTRDGRSLGDTLVAEGLAERWGGARIDWCG